jgi:hypothetical protein
LEPVVVVEQTIQDSDYGGVSYLQNLPLTPALVDDAITNNEEFKLFRDCYCLKLKQSQSYFKKEKTGRRGKVLKATAYQPP